MIKLRKHAEKMLRQELEADVHHRAALRSEEQREAARRERIANGAATQINSVVRGFLGRIDAARTRFERDVLWAGVDKQRLSVIRIQALVSKHKHSDTNLSHFIVAEQ